MKIISILIFFFISFQVFANIEVLIETQSLQNGIQKKKTLRLITAFNQINEISDQIIDDQLKLVISQKDHQSFEIALFLHEDNKNGQVLKYNPEAIAKIGDSTEFQNFDDQGNFIKLKLRPIRVF